MPSTGQVASGARAVLSLDGVKVFYCTQVAFGEEIQFEPVEPLDQLDVAEHVPVAYRVTFSAQRVRVVRESLKLASGVSIFQRLENILQNEVNGVALTGTVEDRITGTVLANLQRVKASRYNATFGARGIVMEDVEFVAIKIRDESEIP